MLKCRTVLKVVRLNPCTKGTLHVPDFPVALGVFLVTRRTQLELTDAQTAGKLGVSIATYRRWETDQACPKIVGMPALVQFLGFSPYEPSLPLRDKLVLWRGLNGITQEQFAEMMQVDQSTLAKWERGDCRPYPILRPRIFAAKRILGEIGCRLLKGLAAEPSPHVNEANNSIRLPRLTVGTVAIRFPPSLFVFYEDRWSIGRKLEVWRTSLGLSQRDFAKITGFAHQSICRWEKGRRSPSAAHIAQIRAVLSEILRHLD